jgi:hypothetical protein
MTQTVDPKVLVTRAVMNYAHDAAELRATLITEFLRGELYSVTFKQHGELRKYYVYLFDNGRTKLLYTGEEVAKEVGSITTQGVFMRLLVGGAVPGIIAIILTLLIAFVTITAAIRGESVQIPDILGAALSVILGFYFGTQVPKH